jgi:hypothetical protein
MRRLLLPLLLLAVPAAGCGGHPDADAQIRAVVRVAYSRTPPSACERLFTPGLMRVAWGGVAGCRARMRSIAKFRPATVRILWIHRHGAVAEARLRIDGGDETSKLVLNRGRWQVDDTIFGMGSLRGGGAT